MKLYKVPVGAGSLWYGTQADAKLGSKQFNSPFEQEDVPVDKEGLLNWLNSHQIIDGMPLDTRDDESHDFLAAAEERAVQASQGRQGGASCSTCGRDYGYDHYESALAARTSIASIDAGMISRAIDQMHGKELAKVVAAAIERLSQLSFALRGGLLDASGETE